MTERKSSGIVRGNPRLTPLMMSSFSRLHESSLNQTSDSGYQSSFASLSSSFTPSSDASDSTTQLYCSTPVTEEFNLPYQTTNLDRVLETPVQHVLSSGKNFSEDRIPFNKRTITPHQDTIECPCDVLSCLIRSQSTPTITKILNYLGDEDLIRLCQVSDDYCRAVCDEKSALERVSKFLILTNQNSENRMTLSNNINGRTYGGVLRPIQNVMPLMQSGFIWTVPPLLESTDMKSVPHLFQKLISMTKTLSEHDCVTNCHTCRSLVAVRIQNNTTVECSKCCCFRRSRRRIGSSRLLTKGKLFTAHR